MSSIRYTRVLIVFAGAVLIQASVWPMWGWPRFQPDWLLIALVGAVVRLPPARAIPLGLLAGWLADCCTQGPVGLGLLPMMAVAHTVSRLREQIFVEHPIVRMLLLMGVATAVWVLRTVLLWLWSWPGDLVVLWWQLVLPQVCLTGLVAPWVLKGLDRIYLQPSAAASEMLR